MNMQQEGNAYMCLDTHPREFTRKRTHKGTRGSNKRAGGCIKICYIFGCKHKCTGGKREVRNEDVDGKESRHMIGVILTSICTVTQVSIKFIEKEERKQKDGDK